MLRPEQMSKVSVTGSKRVLDDVIETVYDLRLLHISDYDASWQGFEPGDSMSGAEQTNDKLVTVRSLESILDIESDDAGAARVIDDDELRTELEEIRETVNELDDRRSDLQSELRETEEKIDEAEPFAELGIELDLLGGYDSLTVAVGQGKREPLERALAAADEIETFEVFSADRTHAVFARPADGAGDDVLADALVGVDFTALDVPESDASPEEYIQELEDRKRQLRSDLETVEGELKEVKTHAAGFLLAAEEQLTIEAQKKEAPLSFATTENAFVAEGWIPTSRFDEFATRLQQTVGDHAEVEELTRASFGSDGSHKHSEDVARGGAGADSPAAADGGEPEREARADGGVVTKNDEPPVVQSNPHGSKSFEVLVEAVGRPNYREFDPTILVFLTFPIMFGFMIGDVGYGLIYLGIGYYLYSQFDSPGFKSMGGVALWAGLFTVIFGLLYAELFGIHLPYHAVLNKGLAPGEIDWALGWLVVSVLVGVVHLNVGYLLSFLEDKEFHGFEEAMYESGSWLLMLNGFWVWAFSAHQSEPKPDFMFTVFNGEPFGLGFSGFPEAVGLVALGAFFVGLALLLKGAPAESVEALSVLVNGLSYTRIAAVLLAKAGMALAVNLLAFGAYVGEDEAFHFIFTGEHLAYVQSHPESYELLFPGLMTQGGAGLLGGILVLVFGHLLVMLLGITSAGLQAVRLEYVEFFGKFYEGGGREYEPFGYERQHTAQD